MSRCSRRFIHSATQRMFRTAVVRPRCIAVLLSLLLFLTALPVKAVPPPDFDIVITNGRIIDGTGSPDRKSVV